MAGSKVAAAGGLQKLWFNLLPASSKATLIVWQASKFLVRMANDVDSTIVSTNNGLVAATDQGETNERLHFEPMRRKLVMSQD